MRGVFSSAHVGLAVAVLLLSASINAGQALHAQTQTAPVAGTVVVVRMMDAVDSASDPAGKQYRASVTKAVDAGNGVMIPQGAVAAVTLTKSGSGYAAQLASININGQSVTVASSSTSVTSAAQSTASSTVGAAASRLGGFGHHVSAASAMTAVAMGRRVVLPPGVTLTFVLGQPPAATITTSTGSVGQSMTASAAHAPGPAPGSVGAAAPGQDWWMCRYADAKDPSKPGVQNRIYYALFPLSAGSSNVGLTAMQSHFNAYVWQNYKLSGQVVDNGTSAVNGRGYCARVSNDSAGRAYSMDMYLKQWASSNIESVHVNWADTPAENAAIDAKLAGSAGSAGTAGGAGAASATPRPAVTTTGGPFISCSTSGGAGIDSYLTGVFQTTHPVKHLPSGGDLVDQSVLDRFYAYLTQKGYKFKPGSNYACAVGRTEAEAEAAKHRRYYEGGACSNCGKMVETGWKDQ